jgi:hypothetical protein
MASQLVEHAAMYSSSVILREMMDCFLIFHEVMDDPKMKHHPEVFFLFEALPTQSESVYPYNLKSQYPI